MKKVIKDKVTLKEFGRVERVRLFIFGILVWTEYNALEAKVQHEERNHRANIAEMEDYLEWRETLKMGNVSDNDFVNILNKKF